MRVSQTFYGWLQDAEGSGALDPFSLSPDKSELRVDAKWLQYLQVHYVFKSACVMRGPLFPVAVKWSTCQWPKLNHLLQPLFWQERGKSCTFLRVTTTFLLATPRLDCIPLGI